MKAAAEPVRCPSSQAAMPEATVLGIVVDTPEGQRLAYLNERVPAQDLLAQVPANLVNRVARVAARCDEQSCAHFGNGACALATRIVERMQPVTDALPPCTIRKSCRWHSQEGAEACYRCPQITTAVEISSPGMAEIAGFRKE